MAESPPERRRLSSAWTCYQKKIWPAFFLAGVSLFPLGIVVPLFMAPETVFVWSVSFLLALTIFVGCLHWVWTLCFRLVDQVWLEGTTILVRNHNLVVRFPATDIADVIHRNSTPEHIELVLRTPCLFGNWVVFMPVLVEKESWRPHPLVKELRCLASGSVYDGPPPKYREAITVL